MEMILTDIFKPDCEQKICCMFCPEGAGCPKCCFKTEEMKDVHCKECFYDKQSRAEAEEIFAKNNE